MKILATTLAIALSIGTAVAALHPPDADVRDDKRDERAALLVWTAWWTAWWTGAEHDDVVQPVHTPPPPVMSIQIPPPTRVKTIAYRETNTDPVRWSFPAPPRPVKTISMRNPHAPPFTQTFGQVPLFTATFQR